MEPGELRVILELDTKKTAPRMAPQDGLIQVVASDLGSATGRRPQEPKSVSIDDRTKD
jgi:hypothetical protein